VTVNAHLEAKEKALGDAVKAGKVERAKRKGLETQVAELKAQVLTLQNQASVATGAETAEADPTAERQKADLEKALFDKNVELADVKQQLDTIKQVLGGTK
jgi:outer membrane murein-binding lipoprotein Lpp